MAVTHDFECAAHGHFEARVKAGTVPRCPKGCSKALVKLVHLRPPGTVGARTRSADRLLRQAAEMQGLSDISTSPSRSGGSVADRNRRKNGAPVQNEMLPTIAQARGAPMSVSQILGALTNKSEMTNALHDSGFGHGYDANEWKKDPKTGTVRHVGAKEAIAKIPTGSTGVSIERVREAPK
jgi:hypothetical protein